MVLKLRIKEFLEIQNFVLRYLRFYGLEFSEIVRRSLRQLLTYVVASKI